MASKITNKLLKDAIADAEAVRETAIANAKLVLEESITPDIKNMISRRLRVEADMEHELEDTPALPKSEPGVKEASEKPFEDADAEHSSETPQDTSAIGGGENKEPSDAAFDASGIGDGGENVDDSHTDWYDDWNESDFDLNEVIKELEEDIAALAQQTEEGYGHEMEGAYEEKEHPTPAAPTVPPSPTASDEMSDDDEEEIDLEEILAELEAGEEDEASEEDAEKHQMAHEIARLQEEVAQHQAAVKTLSGHLREVNLLNAKLLFTNKLFRKEGLNSDQKVRIVESFDRATNVREVKLVYAALVENLSVAAASFNASRKKVVAEGFASKPTPSTAPKQQEVIVENTVARRLQELAGIIS